MLELRRICGTRRVLPSSYKLSSESLLDVEKVPFASTPLMDTYVGFLDGVKVRVKKMRVFPHDDQKKLEVRLPSSPSGDPTC